MISDNIEFAARSRARGGSGLKKFLGRYFYFCMALLIAGLSVWGFSHTVDAHLLHARPARPLVLWLHGAAFSAWIVLFVVQSGLVRVRKVKLHRTLGWFGAALAAIMVVSSFSVSVIMVRFDRIELGMDFSSSLSILWCDMMVFGACMALAIYLRKRPEYHRRFVFLATCQLMQAAFIRFHFIGSHDLYFPALDVLIVAGLFRDLVVDGRVNRVYLYAFPSMIVLQSGAMYLKSVNPHWWRSVTQAILGW